MDDIVSGKNLNGWKGHAMYEFCLLQVYIFKVDLVLNKWNV